MVQLSYLLLYYKIFSSLEQRAPKSLGAKYTMEVGNNTNVMLLFFPIRILPLPIYKTERELGFRFNIPTRINGQLAPF